MSKITQETAQRCTAHTLADQLADLRAIHAVEMAIMLKRQNHDQDDVVTAFEADSAWSGQHARLSKGWDVSGPD